MATTTVAPTTQARSCTIRRQGRSPPQVACLQRFRFAATLLNNGKVLVTGGYPGLAPAESYDPADGTFARPATCWWEGLATATLLPSGKVLIAGGLNNCDQPVSSAELFDVSAGGFTWTGSMTTARAAPTATLLEDGTVLVAGGAGNNGDLASAEIYQ